MCSKPQGRLTVATVVIFQQNSKLVKTTLMSLSYLLPMEAKMQNGDTDSSSEGIEPHHIQYDLDH